MSQTKEQIYYFRGIIQQVEKGQISPAYFLYGEEVYLMDELVARIAEKFIGKIEKEINYFVRYATDVPLENILALSAGGGLFSEKKLIIYRDYHQLKNPDIARLIKYLENPNPEICLVITARISNIRQKKYQQLLPYVTPVFLNPLRDKELYQFVQGEFKKYGKNISLEGAQTLVYLVGEQIHDLKTEIVQIANFYMDEKEITPAHVEEIAGVYAVHDVFELARTLARRDRERAFYILHQLLERGESPLGILAMLLRHILILWKIRGYINSGEKNPRRIQSELNLYSKHYEEYRKDVPYWSMEQLQSAIAVLKETDALVKSSQMSDVVLMDRLILKLTSL
ncbi:MAG: DNA polymerase III subunit delta [Calditrichaeota bacterium]|nr:MAG: DNA polymerase III subunit delta [Calditrichota bacterium]